MVRNMHENNRSNFHLVGRGVINRKMALPVIILALLVLMVCYSLLDGGGISFDEKSVMVRDVAITEEFRQWAAETEAILIAYDDEAIPFIDDDENAKGFFVDYFNIIAEAIGVEVVLVRVENGAMRRLLDGGGVHGGIVIAGHEADADRLTSMPIIPVNGVICVRPDFDLNSVADFRGARVTAIESGAAERWLKSENIDYIAGKSLRECMDRLMNGEADCYVGNESAVRAYLLANGLADSFRVVAGHPYDGNYCFVASAQNQALYRVMNDSIYNINGGAVIPELQSKWFGLAHPLYPENASRRAAVIFVIVMASILCLFYLFYITNRGVYAELKDRTEILMASKRELEATFDGVTYFIAEVDRNCRVLTLNKAFLQHVNIAKSEAAGRPITAFLNVAPVRKGDNELTALIDKTYGEEKKKSGEFFSGKKIFNIHTFPIENSKGQTAKVLLMIMDVTKERSAERQMIQDSKMIAVGQLASGVAHEIRNPLGVIMNYCYVLKNLDTGDEKNRLEAIHIIEKAVKRSGKIIDNLLNFSRLSSDRRERIVLHSHIKAILSLHADFGGQSNITVDFICPDDIVFYTGVDSLDMIVINLLSNALDALEGRGTVTVKCMQNEKEVVVEVSDTGSGIPAEVMEEIFNPFFTTKPRREGNGLGLYIVYNELQKLNGDITVESEPGAGTRFTVMLPKEGE